MCTKGTVWTGGAESASRMCCRSGMLRRFVISSHHRDDKITHGEVVGDVEPFCKNENYIQNFCRKNLKRRDDIEQHLKNYKINGVRGCERIPPF